MFAMPSGCWLLSSALDSCDSVNNITVAKTYKKVLAPIMPSARQIGAQHRPCAVRLLVFTFIRTTPGYCATIGWQDYAKLTILTAQPRKRIYSKRRPQGHATCPFGKSQLS